MGVTYKTLWPELPEFRVLVLHRVVYAHTTDGAMAMYQISYKDYTITIPWMTYHQNPESAGMFLVRNHSVVGCKFFVLEQAEKFKVAMEKRLAWYRLSGGRKWE